MSEEYVFLLTPLREGRRGRRDAGWHHADFYSRPCGRGDALTIAQIQDVIISTHAPAGGATKATISDGEGEYTFLLTPLREGRLECELKELLKNKISTHAPAGGATRSTTCVCSL